MKTKVNTIKGLVLVLLIVCTKTSFAQSNEVLNNAISNSTYIFTGIVIEKKSQWTEGKGLIYTYNKIKVDQCLKGNLKHGQILQIITEGGQIDNTLQDVTHSIQFGLGLNGMYFCNINESSVGVETSSLTLKSVNDSEFGFIQFLNPERNPFGFGFELKFDTFTELTHYLNSFKDLQAFIPKGISKNKIQVETVVIEHQSSNTQDEANKYFETLNLKIKNARLNKSSFRTVNPLVNFYIENTIVTGFSPNNALEFDILVNTDASGIFFDNSLMRLSYNTTVFGDNIFTSGNVTLSRGTVLSNATVYQDPISQDYTNNTFAIGVGTNTSVDNSQNFGSRFLLSSKKQKLVHVKLLFENPSNCLQKANIAFVDFQEINDFGVFEVYTLTANSPYDGSAMTSFDANGSNDIIPVPLCPDPVITGFSQNTINAGRGNTLRIYGYNLGNINDSELWFKNCDDGGILDIKIDPSDIIIDPLGNTAWSNTSIELVFPSVCEEGISTSTGFKEGKLGSGKATIQNGAYNSFQPGVSTLPLEVHYSIGNAIVSGNPHKVKRNLTNQNATGGYKFTMSSEVKNNAAAVELIRIAISKWRCATGINFQLDMENTSEVGVNDDQLNTISFKNIIGEGTSTACTTCNGRTTTWTDICDKPVFTNIDIQLKSPSTTSWFMGGESESVPVGQFDFLQVILHELGHAHNLNHVNNNKEIMYYGSHDKGILSTDRIIDIANSLAALDGGNYVTSYSTGTSCAGVNTPSMIYVSECSFHDEWNDPNDIAENFVGDSFDAFPNPFENILNVEFEIPTNSNTRVSLTNAVGQEISIIEKNQLPEGKYRISFHEDIPAGIFIVHLIVNDHFYSKKVIKY